MAERRMFAKTIIDSDAFLDMPLSAQALYFHLSMRADDEGFLNNSKKIQRMIGASDDDLKLLVAKRFVIPFETGVMVIKHWRIHNYIQSDRFKPTVYTEERAMLTLKDNNAYTLDTVCIQNGYSLETQDSIGKDSIGKISIGEDRKEESGLKSTSSHFTPPTLDQVIAYCKERQNNIDAEYFLDYYQARGWYLSNGKKCRDWKSCVRTWERNNKNNRFSPPAQKRLSDIDERQNDYGQILKSLPNALDDF